MRFWPRLTWAQPGGLPECPYFRRWVADFGAFSIRLHRWYADDDHRALHDHPFWFVTIVLWGGYDDVSPVGGSHDDSGAVVHRRLTRGSVRFRPALYRHSVQNVRPGTTTLLVTGRPSRRWGFWTGANLDKLVRRDKYFATRGHHPCDPVGEGVRMRPDGSRIEKVQA